MDGRWIFRVGMIFSFRFKAASKARPSATSPSRVAAAKALGKLVNGSDEVIRVLLKHRNDPDVRIRAEVDRALVLIISSRGEANLP